MSFCYREQRQLRDIEAGLFRSDSRLAGMLFVFGRLYRGQEMPASERVLSGQGRDQGAVTPDRGGIRRRRPRSQHPVQRGAHPAISVRRARVRPPAARPERTGARPRSRRSAEPSQTGSPAAPSAARPGLRSGAGHRGIHPDRAMAAHPVGAETRSRVLQSGGDHHQAGHSRNIRRVRRCAVSKPAARAGIRSLSATRSVSAAAWARRCAPRSRSSRPVRTATRPC